MQPPVLNIKKLAVFLDFDGTLVDFAAKPEGVVVSPDLKALLTQLHSATSGALALVTGRSLESLDSLIDNAELCAAGCHGAEWRQGGTAGAVDATQAQALDVTRAALEDFATEHGLRIEHKPYSLALHFRHAPDLEPKVDEWLANNMSAQAELRVIGGKFIREVQLQGVDKGTAVERFMSTSPFAGRTPVFVGDDVTDEDAFAWVTTAEGVAIKVGEGETVANYRLPNHLAVHKWLESLLGQEEQV